MQNTTTSSTRKDQSPSGSFTPLRNSIVRNKRIRSDLLLAMSNKELEVFYQPQFDTKDNSCGHLEALVRWKHPKFGFISPATFIPIAEEFGLIQEITKFVIDRAVSDISNWKKLGLPVSSIAVNISAKLLSSQANARQLLTVLRSIVSFAPCIVLELTETSMVQDVNLAHIYMTEFRNLGFKIALDDFGTGYSSMAYLLEFPIDTIKIDRRFASTIRRSLKSRVIINAVVILAEGLGMNVVVEGVEHAEEVELLRELGCTQFQGFYFSRPLPKDKVEELFARRQLTG